MFEGLPWEKDKCAIYTNFENQTVDMGPCTNQPLYSSSGLIYSCSTVLNFSIK